LFEIDADGWRVAADPPVRFLRPRGMLPLPAPEPGGSLAELRDYVNVGDEDGWALLLAWLLYSLRPAGPYPLLVVNGEQGSAKSTLTRLLRLLVDPNAAPVRAEPRDARDLMIAAQNGHVIALDNVSALPPWLSDALCRLSTGGGMATRELYTDGEEKLFDAMRPAVLNGIEDFVGRSDLADRCVTVALQPILPSHRKPESVLWAEFERARPHILGALLDAYSAALGKLRQVRVAELPRMADFALFAIAGERALGLAEGAFLAAYTGNRAANNAQAVEASPIGPAVLALVQDSGQWEGTFNELLGKLNSITDEATRRRKDWPQTPRKLSGELRRLAPNLRQEGVEVSVSDVRSKHGRRLTLARGQYEPSPPSPPSPDSVTGGEEGLPAGRGAGQVTVPAGARLGGRSPPQRDTAPGWPPGDGSDGSDGRPQAP
jgi:hypothetical protein